MSMFGSNFLLSAILGIAGTAAAGSYGIFNFLNKEAKVDVSRQSSDQMEDSLDGQLGTEDEGDDPHHLLEKTLTEKGLRDNEQDLKEEEREPVAEYILKATNSENNKPVCSKWFKGEHELIKEEVSQEDECQKLIDEKWKDQQQPWVWISSDSEEIENILSQYDLYDSSISEIENKKVWNKNFLRCSQEKDSTNDQKTLVICERDESVTTDEEILSSSHPLIS